MKYTIRPLNIINDDGEILHTNDFKYSTMQEKDLTDLLVAIKLFANSLREEVSLIEAEFLRRMAADEATKYEDKEYKILIQNKNEYEYDTETVNKLKSHISEEQFNQTFNIKYVANRTLLKSLECLGGTVKKLIKKATTVKPQKPYLKIEKKF